MIGQQILNYKIISLLGEGGMGTVYLAEHVKLGRKVAIKVLLPHLVKNELVRSRFVNEAKLMSALQHPNIVTLFDYVEDENGMSLIMELVDGKPLDEYIQDVTGPIQEKEAIQIMEQALEGFSYAHKQGLIHRDIKPSNLVRTQTNEIKILDFGIAKLVGDLGNKLTKTGSHIGTVYYMSPEQVRGLELDLRSDIYALGITLYQMLTGLCPYEGLTTEFDVFNKIVGEDLPDPKSIYPGISDHMCRVIKKATEKKPEDRFQNCKDFIQALKKDDFGLSLETKKEVTIDATDQPIKTTVVPIIIEEKPNLSVKENVLEKPVEETITTAETNKANNPKNPEKDKKKNKKGMLVLFAGIGLVTLCTTIFLLSKSTGEDKGKSESLSENQSTNNKNNMVPPEKTMNDPSNQNGNETKKNKPVLNEKPVVTAKVVQKTNPTVKDQVVVKSNPTDEIIAAERADPLKYLSFKNDEGRKNIVNIIKINIEISNSAKYVGYSKFELKTFYFDNNGDKIGHDTKILSILIKPGAKYTDELKFSCPIGVKSWNIKLKSATAAN